MPAVATAPESLKLELFPQQAAFVLDTTLHAAAVTGVGAGKTRAGAVKALKYAVDHPRSLQMVTAPTFPMLRDTTLRTVLQDVWPKSVIKDWLASEMRLVLVNGSEVLFRSTDNPDHLRGPNLAAVWMDEAAQSSEEAFKILQGRLRQTGFPPQLWITSTPRGFNWLFQEFAKQERPSYRLFRWSSRDNPFLPKPFIQNLTESYSKEFALQEVEGQFTVVGGNAFFDQEALSLMLADCVLGKTESGLITVWKPPYVGGHYVFGLDTAWGKTGSCSAGVMLDMRTSEQVAALHGRPDLDDLAQSSVTLCKRYNHAFAGIEWAGDEDEGQYVVRMMAELGYGPHMYYRDGNGKRENPGWVTSPATRPYILAQMAAAVKNRQVVPRDERWVKEMMAFVRDEPGRPAAAHGMKDDLVMGGAIAYEMRNHAIFGESLVVKVKHHGEMPKDREVVGVRHR